MKSKIPILDLKEQTRAIDAEVLAAFQNVILGGMFIKGPEVKQFQEEFSAWVGASHAVGVANGTDALVLALRALDIGPGDEVVTTPFSFIATAECISLVGARPVFADIRPDTFNIDPARVAEKITPRTKAVIGVHLYGNPCDATALRALCDKHKIAFIEDCAQAAGASLGGRRVGSFGDFGCFSFFPSKNLGAFGDAGAVTAQREEHAVKIAVLADHGSRERYHHDHVGTNSRLDTLQAAVLRIKLPRVDGWNERRRAIAARYTKNLSGSGLITPYELPDYRHVYHQYTLRVPRYRDALHAALNSDGVTAVVYYPISLHLQKVYLPLACERGSFPSAETAQDEVLSLPMYPELSDAQVDHISELCIAHYRALQARGAGVAG